MEEYWLGEDDLEPDDGGPLDIEHPTEIATKLLSPKDQDGRVRMVCRSFQWTGTGWQ